MEFFKSREGVLTLLALIGGGISPLLVVFSSAGLAPFPPLFWAVAVSGETILFGILLYAKIGYMPDMPTQFGRMIARIGMKADVTPLVYLGGGVYHFFNGIAFGVVYSIIFGRTPWWGAVLYSVFFVELGMMTLPPMAKMMGPFGIAKFGTMWNGMFLTTLLAHVALGVALGIVVQKWGGYQGPLFERGRRLGAIGAGTPA